MDAFWNGGQCIQLLVETMGVTVFLRSPSSPVFMSLARENSVSSAGSRQEYNPLTALLGFLGRL